jgi:hypothetical protein
VVHRQRLAGPQDVQAHTELIEMAATFERRRQAAALLVKPDRLASVDDIPAWPGWNDPYSTLSISASETTAGS